MCGKKVAWWQDTLVVTRPTRTVYTTETALYTPGSMSNQVVGLRASMNECFVTNPFSSYLGQTPDCGDSDYTPLYKTVWLPDNMCMPCLWEASPYGTIQCWSPRGHVLGLEAPRGQYGMSLALAVRLKSLGLALGSAPLPWPWPWTMCPWLQHWHYIENAHNIFTFQD